MFKFFSNLKLGPKMIASFSLILALLVVVGVVALGRLNNINDTVNLMATHLSVEQKDAASLIGYVEDMRFHAVRYIAGGDEADFKQHQQSYDNLKSQVVEMEAEDVDASTDKVALGTLLDASEAYNANVVRVNELVTKQQSAIIARMDSQAATVDETFSNMRESFANTEDTALLNTLGTAMLHWDEIKQTSAELLTRSDTDISAVQEYTRHTLDALDTLARQPLSDGNKKLLSEVKANINLYYQAAKDLSYAIGERKNLLVEQNQLGEQMLSAAQAISAGKQAAFAVAQTHAQNLVTQTRNILIPLILATIVAGLVIGWTMTRIIGSSLGYVVKAVKAMEVGDLSASVVKLTHRGDEIGEFARAFEAMIASEKKLAEVADNIAAGDLTVQVEPRSDRDTMGVAIKSILESFREQTSELMNGVAVLSSASSQFISTSAELAANASQTASAITETTATIAEVRQTAEVAAEKAQVVAKKVQENAEYSQVGLQSVQNAIQAMETIDEHIDSIAESIVHLSEQGQTIGSIITAVDDLAEQSNLLAVNAAIEAAKAGEHGKGFAVVAQEIKNLAEQSKQFTLQVQGILNDIQKATAKAVMTTEEGSKAVLQGKKQSHEAGEAIEGLTDHVTEAAQASMHISASSNEQLMGVEQVALAMENIKQASAQNVEGARQLEGASQNLEQLARQIQNMFTKYQL